MELGIRTQQPASIESIPGEIRWYHVARSRAVRRIVDKGIARWAELHGLRGPPSVASYRAFLQREGDGHLVHCQIEVVAGSQAWSGSWVGQGIQQALVACLAHMSLERGCR